MEQVTKVAESRGYWSRPETPITRDPSTNPFNQKNFKQLTEKEFARSMNERKAHGMNITEVTTIGTISVED